MVDQQREVIKASGAIHIQNTISLLQRRAWTVLLANAYDELPVKERHAITIKELADVLEYHSHDRNHVKSALRSLVTCEVEWNILDKDQSWEWGTTTLLAEAKIKNGVCTYAFGPTLRERLHNPRMYARISLSLQNKFDSKHALALWEICLDYLNHEKNYGETPYIGIAVFRNLMGIPDHRYPDFKTFNRRVIKQPIEEINAKTDFHITAEYSRKRRKIEGVKFRFRRILPLAPEQTNQTLLFPLEEDMPSIVKELHQAGFARHTAWEIWQHGFDQVDADKRPRGVDFDEYIREKISLLGQQRKGQVRNPTGFLRDAIQKNYPLSSPPTSKTKRTAPKRQEARPDPADDLHARCVELIKAQPELLAAHLETSALRKAEPFLYRQCVDSLHQESLLWNYEHHPALAAYVDRQLVAAYPEHFVGVAVQD
jgi:hypothetical protein